MKENNNSVMFVAIIGLLLVVNILATVFIVDTKTTNISNDVIAKYLAIEYDKVGGKENYETINTIQKEQIITSLQQYKDAGGAVLQPQANNAPTPPPIGTSITVEQAKKITSDGTYILGNPDAEVTWVEYSDLECPFCKKLHQAGTIKEVMDAYDGKVNFVFKQFPLNFHANAPKESEGVLCAGELGGSDKYYSFVNTIFERTRGNGTGFALDALVPLAKELGLDELAFKTCLDSGKYASRVQAEMAEGQTFGITGTPGNVLINNKTGKWDTLPGAYPTASFKQKIDLLLE